MGCDGGSIPKRIELVRTKTAAIKTQDGKLAKQDSFKYCTVSKEPLRSPVVMCSSGRLYNKESILKVLLERRMLTDSGPTESLATVAHIKGIKDVKKLNLTSNPAFDDVDASPSGCPFICPITRKEMNGTIKFLMLKNCGCVIAEQALKEVSSETCLNCGKVRVANDLAEINPAPINNIDIPRKPTERAMDRKRPAEKDVSATENAPVYLPDERGYRPSLSGMATFRKTPAIDSLYRK